MGRTGKEDDALTNYHEKLISFPEGELLARLIWGEARNQPLRGLAAIANVVLNRVHDDYKRFGKTVFDVITKKWQFSCLNGLWSDDLSDDDPNLVQVLGDPKEPITACRTIAHLALDGLLIDPTGWATHYHTKTVDPKWNDDPTKMIYTVTIGDHLFYREL